MEVGAGSGCWGVKAAVRGPPRLSLQRAPRWIGSAAPVAPLCRQQRWLVRACAGRAAAPSAQAGAPHEQSATRHRVTMQIDGELIEPPKPLPWYPHKLAWQFNFSRSQVRATRHLYESSLVV